VIPISTKPNCSPDKIIFDSLTFEWICLETGEVIGQEIDMTPEWRAFSQEELDKRSRTSGKITNEGLQTTYSKHREKQSPESRRKIKQMVIKLNSASRFIYKQDKFKSKIRDLIYTYAQTLNLPKSIADEAFELYSKIRKSGIFKGALNSNAIALACLYITCRKHEIPRSIKEFSSLGVSRSDLFTWYKRILNMTKENVPRVDLKLYIEKICRSLEAQPETIRTAFEIYDKLTQINYPPLFGKNPTGMAAGIVYIAVNLAKDKISIKKLSEVTNIADITIRSRAKEIAKALNIDLK